MSDAESRLDAILATLEEMTERAEANLARSQEEGEVSARERAEANRAGSNGPAWQVLQRRIDRGETTLAAVLDGTDESTEAREVSALARERLTRLREEMEGAHLLDPEAPDPAGEAARLGDELATHVAAARARVGQV